MSRIVYHIDTLNLPGGISRIVSLKANWWAKNGYDVTILTTEGETEKSCFPLDERIKVIALNINFLTVYAYKRNIVGMLKSYFDRHCKKKKHRRVLEEYLRNHPCDVFFTTMNGSYIPKLQNAGKIIYETHFSAEAQNDFIRRLPLVFRICYRLYNTMQNRILRQYDHVVLLTEKDYQLRKSPKNAIVIPNFITIAPSDVQLDYQIPRVISVGRLCDAKGFDCLFRAWEIVHRTYPDWELHVYGYGYGREKEYQQLIHELGLAGVIHIHPPVKNIQEKYQDSSFYVMSSRYEGFPLVLGEAMACGLPCVAYDCNCGPSEIIKDWEDGILVSPVGDIAALSQAIMFMIGHPEKRKEMGEKARKNVRRLDQAPIMEKWVQLIQS